MRIRLLHWLALYIITCASMKEAISQNTRFVDSTDFRVKRDIIDLFQDWKWKGSTDKKPKRVTNRLHVSLIPTVSGVPGTSGVAFVTAVSAAFFLGSPLTTNLSNIYFFPYTNFKGKWVVPFRSYIWTKDNKWNLVGDYRYVIYPELTYGLGSSTTEANETLIEYKQLRLHQSVLHQVIGHWVMGGGVHIDDHYSISVHETETSKKIETDYNLQPQTSTLSRGITYNTAYDSRLNALNAQQGIYAGFEYKFVPKEFGSTYTWHSVLADVKLYHSFNRKRQQVLAFWAFYWDVFKGQAPYLDLPSTFWDQNYRAGRGYYPGRFRGDAMGYTEAEYRFDITKSGMWGATVFANAQTLREPITKQFGRIAPAAGMGLRLKFNKFSNTNLTFDVAIGLESWNYFFGLGEFF